VDGGLIRHALFDEAEAPRHYENVDQLELHLNEVSLPFIHFDLRHSIQDKYTITKTHE
jgi:hypothetical protein